MLEGEEDAMIGVSDNEFVDGTILVDSVGGSLVG